MRYRLLVLVACLSGCSTAFEVGEALNRATSNIASDPARYLWSRDPGSDGTVTTDTPASAVPAIAQPQR